jgi:hypothetical protein
MIADVDRRAKVGTQIEQKFEFRIRRHFSMQPLEPHGYNQRTPLWPVANEAGVSAFFVHLRAQGSGKPT